ncbi:MAG: lipoate protein ligase C-terminal domain-containing protein [Candidatus Korarchaeum sp.]|nr:lipoate protein ligase C-terminal domain-containing protein [Candidatus Korarchaeum sp.]
MKVIRSKAGKTLELTLELEGNVIKRIEISGDFMAHPSDTIEELERRLRGVRLGSMRA